VVGGRGDGGRQVAQWRLPAAGGGRPTSVRMAVTRRADGVATRGAGVSAARGAGVSAARGAAWQQPAGRAWRQPAGRAWRQPAGRAWRQPAGRAWRDDAAPGGRPVGAEGTIGARRGSGSCWEGEGDGEEPPQGASLPTPPLRLYARSGTGRVGTALLCVGEAWEDRVAPI